MYKAFVQKVFTDHDKKVQGFIQYSHKRAGEANSLIKDR